MYKECSQLLFYSRLFYAALVLTLPCQFTPFLNLCSLILVYYYYVAKLLFLIGISFLFTPFYLHLFFHESNLGVKQELGMLIFEVLTAVFLKTLFSSNMRLCRRVDGSWHFEETLGTIALGHNAISRKKCIFRFLVLYDSFLL